MAWRIGDRPGRLVATAIVIGGLQCAWCGTAVSGVDAPPQEDPVDYSFELSGSATKSKTTAIAESIQRSKDIRIDVATMAVAARVAEALSLLSQVNDGVAVATQATRTDTLSVSGNGGSGMTVINQASGNMNNQDSSFSLAAVNQPGEAVFAEAQAAVAQRNGAIEEQDGETGERVFAALTSFVTLALAENAVSRSASATDSINANTGMNHVNQSAGSVNNQGNALSLSMGLGSGGVLLSDASLGQANFAAQISMFAVQRSAAITRSVQANDGVVGLNQSAGSMSNQANVLANGVAILN